MMHAPPLFFVAEIAEVTSSPSKNHKLNDDWFKDMARLVALSYGCGSVMVPGCLCDDTDILYSLCSAL